MAYFCKECSYRGKVSGQAGECPACGSFNLVMNEDVKKDEPAPSKWRLVVVSILWSYLLLMIIWKLLS